MVLLDDYENIGLLRHFSPVYRKQIASLAEPRECLPGACIFQEGERERHVYLVVEGEVMLEIKVPNMGTVRVHQVGAGDLLGWSPVLGRHAMTATARALTACRLLAFDAEYIRVLAERDTRFGLEFFRTMTSALADRLRATRLQLPDPRMHYPLGTSEGAD
jgi:CRP-like cAMP-binding protein